MFKTIELPSTVKLVVIFKSNPKENADCFNIFLPELVPFGTTISFHNLSNQSAIIHAPNRIIDGMEGFRHLEVNGIRTYGLVENVGWVTFGT